MTADAPAGPGPSGPVDPDRLARLLYDRHGPALRRWSAGRFPDHQVAEEVVQETITKAWRNHDQFDPGRGSERAWMFGIARNVAASRHRRDARHLRTVPTDDLTQPGADDAELSRVSELALIVDAFASLSDDHRTVVVAAYWEGLSTREIAARLSVPDGTVKSRLHYALRILRTQLEERGMLR